MSQEKKMGGPKRTSEERERDLAIVAELYLKGLPESEIAAAVSDQYEFTLSTRTIRNDKAELRKRWIQSQLVNFDEAKARELELIDRVIEACWIGWENSLRDGGDKVIEKMKDDKLPGGESRDPVTVKTVKKVVKHFERDGNIAFLQEIRKLSEQRSKILGLFEAQEIRLDWKERLEKAGLPEQDIEKTLEQAVSIAEGAFKKWEDDPE